MSTGILLGKLFMYIVLLLILILIIKKLQRNRRNCETKQEKVTLKNQQ